VTSRSSIDRQASAKLHGIACQKTVTFVSVSLKYVFHEESFRPDKMFYCVHIPSFSQISQSDVQSVKSLSVFCHHTSEFFQVV
jgi:hypothetical protein